MDKITFIDTTIRDGDQSLWGYRMTTGMLIPVVSQFDRAGFEAMETPALISIKTLVREQREEPWERIHLLSKQIIRTPRSIMAGASGGQFHIGMPLAVANLRLQRFAAKGVKRVQILGFLNDMNFKVPQIVRFARDAGLHVVIGLTYTLSPRHTDEYYAQKTRDAVKLKPDRIYLKDPGGLLTPERTQTLIPAIQQNCSGLPVEFHSHCTTGLAPLCYLEAIKLGVRTLHTGIVPLANGPALPSVLNIVRNARLLGYDPQIDEEAIKKISDHFHIVAKREGLPIGMPVEYDRGQYMHQVPGGVISNLKRQLAEMKVEGQIAAVLGEAIQVRQDLGYPIMVTPFSQHVVTQATINVMLGERYREVTDELIEYCLGYFGEEAGSGIDPAVKKKILRRPRAKELAKQQPAEPSIEEIREKFGVPGVSEDELLLRCMIAEEDLRALRPAPPIKEYPTTRISLIYLIEELMKLRDFGHIKVEKGDLLLTMGKSSFYGRREPYAGR